MVRWHWQGVTKRSIEQAVCAPAPSSYLRCSRAFPAVLRVCQIVFLSVPRVCGVLQLLQLPCVHPWTAPSVGSVTMEGNVVVLAVFLLYSASAQFGSGALAVRSAGRGEVAEKSTVPVLGACHGDLVAFVY